MANNYAQGTFEPEIPFNLFTESDLNLLDALGVSVDKGPDGLCYLYNENYCTTGYIEVDGAETEVVEDDLYAMLQEVIKRSNGEIRFITHEQAYTCDKMRKGEFGGSAVFITADDVQYHGTSSWLQRRIAEVETGDTGSDTEEPDNFSVDLIRALQACWNFIENVTEDDPERSNKFFELRAQVRDAFASSGCNFNGEPSSSEIVLHNEAELRGALQQCLDQIYQMQGMFNDEDGTIRQAITDAEVALALPNSYSRPTNLAIVLDGGLVQAVVTDNPAAFKGVNTMIIDYDTDCLDPDDDYLGLVLQQDGSLAEAYMRGISIDPAAIDLGQVADFVSDEAYGSTQQRKAICGGYPCEGCPDVNLNDDRCVNEPICLAWTRYNDNKAIPAP